jgi:hypothetical protein
MKKHTNTKNSNKYNMGLYIIVHPRGRMEKEIGKGGKKTNHTNTKYIATSTVHPRGRGKKKQTYKYQK